VHPSDPPEERRIPQGRLVTRPPGHQQDIRASDVIQRVLHMQGQRPGVAAHDPAFTRDEANRRLGQPAENLIGPDAV
jgi:hypothetical protein